MSTAAAKERNSLRLGMMQWMVNWSSVCCGDRFDSVLSLGCMCERAIREMAALEWRVCVLGVCRHMKC